MHVNKASATDGIVNEYIKTTLDTFLPLYTNLFNLVLDTGILPEAWLEGIIRPIYKGKGCQGEPENYRTDYLSQLFRQTIHFSVAKQNK